MQKRRTQEVKALNLNKIELRIDLEESLSNTFRIDRSIASTRRAYDPTSPVKKRSSYADPDLIEP
jgi:hypothetical protein